jgi:hypothetical protein
MIEIVKIVAVEPVAAYRLRVHFSNGSLGEHDFSAKAGEQRLMIESLPDPRYFEPAFLEPGVLAWPNGFDIDSIGLHREIKAAGDFQPRSRRMRNSPARPV